ncbi:response regulator [Hymenobacter sp. ASUV-10]|uniref:Response regulator n=1 Tax=Hymenobacter aranciens TaxID=3063996 RepID=A0ABT9BEV3_9BACT|nr:response regulator [Hymenobacter sp. ASUV-10]MDO7876799.1 response regulator [Hymenobacter sp. ASUV-10]
MESNITLLIVEDEALIAENLRLSLEDLGYAVAATCYTYAEAQQAFQQHTPDLVLLDINLSSPDPAHNGLALAAQLGSTPFIFLTAYSDLDTIRQATRLQPSGYLIKPVNSATLFAAIQTAIERNISRQPAPLPAPSAAPAEAPDYFFVKNGLHTVKLYWREVASLEAGKNYVTLRAPALRLSHAVRGSLTYVLDQLLPAPLREQFIRVNRATALNANFISSFDQDFVYCGAERYENGRTALKQLQELELR